MVFTMVFSKYPDRYFKFSVITAHTNFPPSEKMGTCYVLVAPAHNCLYTGVLFTAFPQTVAMGLLFFFVFFFLTLTTDASKFVLEAGFYV